MIRLRAVARALALVAAILLAPLSVAARAINFPANATSIQAALDSSATGDTVLVAPGDYSWTTGPLSFRGKNLVLRSSGGPWVTTLRGAPHDYAIVFQQGEGYTARLDGFTIQVGELGASNVVLVRGAWPTINNCVIVGNHSTGLGCAFYITNGTFGGAHPIITNCVIAFNTGRGGSAIRVKFDSDAEITGCTIYGNSSGVAGCPTNNGQIYAGTAGPIVSVQRSIIAGSPDDLAVSCLSETVLGCCDLYGNACGNYVGCITGYLGRNGNFSADPRLCGPGPQALNFRLLANSPCLPGNHPQGQNCGLIGALGEGCSDPTATEATTWGALKGLFR